MALPRLTFLLAICLVIFRTTFAGAQTPPIATVGLTPGWATFGQAVPQGLAHDGLQVGNLPTQTDVKNRWPDGTIRFAIVTTRVPSAGMFAVASASPSTGGFSPSWPDASVTLVINGITYSAVLPGALPEDAWLAGPLVHEGRHVVTPISEASGAAHPFVRVNFDARAYNNGEARLDVSVENVLDTAEATTVAYDVTIRINGQAVFTKNNLEHYYLTRWRKVFAIGSTTLAAITPDMAPFYASKALPPYLSPVGNVVSTPAGPSYDLLRSGALQPNMSDEGHRPELAPFPDWTARYLVHRDVTQRSFVLANGDLSGSWPIHMRETETSSASGVGAERLVSIEQRPAVWLGDRAQGAAWDAIQGTPLPMRDPGIATPGPGQSELVPDNAHQPSLAYVPYLMTGDRYYAEEMAFWANYAMVRTDPGDGIRGSLGILANNEVSGYGWALRNLVDAASYYPDASPVKAYLSRKVSSNLQWLNAYAAAQNPNINPFQVLWINKRSEGGQYIALWEQSYLAHAIDRANQQGFAGGLAHRDAIARLQLRLFASEPDYPREYGAPHLLAVGTANASDPATLAAFHTTMSQIWSGTIGQERPFAGFYGLETRLNLLLGVQSGWPGAQEADAYLWPSISSELALRAGWALGAPPQVSGDETPEAGGPSIVEPNQGTVIIPTETGGTSALPENIPDFSADPTRISIASVQSGDWSSSATWAGGQVPTLNHVVRIAQGHTVTITDTAAVAYTIAVDGTLTFAPTVNTRLTVTNLQVMAGSDGMGAPGILEVGTVATPIAAGVTAEIVIADSPLGGSVPDAEQFGTGIIVFGKVTMHGSVRTPTFVRLATEPLAGHTTLTLSEAVSGWREGDRLVLPDTRHIKESEVTGGGWLNTVNQWEELTLQSVSADGKTLTLAGPLVYDHLGARDFNGELEFLPHVGNLTRNVIVRSADPSGTRGHTLFTHMADVDVRYALYKDLGRTTYLPLDDVTNHIGRYPLHAHHLSGPLPTPANGFQFTLVGNAVDGGSIETRFKWGIAIHASHYGLIQDNVVYNYNGASVVTEDGSESYNVFDHNFALRGMGQPNDVLGEARSAMGTEGVGFWFRGPNNYVRNNVAANFQNPVTEAAYGFVYQFRFLGDIEVPNFKGAHRMGTTDPGLFTTMNGNNLPLLQFENNEAYGAMQGGFTYWWISSQDPQPFAGAQESVIKDLKIWHVYNKGVYIYPGQKVTFDGLKILGGFDAASRCCGDGVYFADYMAKDIVIRNSDIQGMEQGIIAPMAGFGPNAHLTIDDTYLRNWYNVTVPSVGSVNGCWMDDKLVVLINSRLEMAPGRAANHIAMVGDVAFVPALCLAKLSEMRVYAYNGVATDNFQVYHPDPLVLPRPPADCISLTRPGVNGPVCAIAPLTPVPTASINIAPFTIDRGQTATLTWNTANATTVLIDHDIGLVPASGTLTVSPTNTTSYTLTATGTTGSVTATTTVTVRIPPDITWNAPANIVYGTPLSATQLNATVEGTVFGSFAYSPAAGAILPAGTNPLSVTFTPNDTAHFVPSTKVVSIIVSKATPVVAWTPPAAIVSGTPLGATQLNASATVQSVTVPGTFAYTPGPGMILAPGSHTLSVTFTPTDTNNYNNATASVSITVKETPIISWAPPANVTYGTPLSATQLNASATVAGINVQGTFAYIPAAGAILTAGSHTLSVTFTPADQAAYVLASASVPITVGKATPVLTWSPPANIVYGTPLSAAQLNASTSVASLPPVYTRDSGPVVTAGTVLTAGTHTLSVTFTPTDTTNYNNAVASVPLTVVKTTPVISWATPANIVAGTPLSATQLNAGATVQGTTVPGTFAYTPGSGTILTPGSHTLSVTFTPTDTNNYNNGATASVSITVKETPILSWAPPANITYGTPLSATQLNASATVEGINVQGTFAYTPAEGAILNAGTHTLSVTFTPTDQAGYVLSSASVPITVAKATPVLTWAPPANIVYGTPLGALQLSASTPVPGTFAFTRDSGAVVTAGTVLTAGPHTLSVTFTPTAIANYLTATASVSITVVTATPVISWATPANIAAGTPLSATQLSATVASPPGTLSYSPDTGHVLPVGAAQLLSVTFTPIDTANHNTVTRTVPITVVGAGSTPPVTPPVKIGSQISGTFRDATGHSGQSHLVYAPNAGVWWFFTLTSASDALNNQRVQAYVSSGPDLGSATWTAGTVSPNLPRVNSPNSLLAGGRSLGVAIRTIGSGDYAHVFASAASDGQTSQNGHIRAQLGTTSITWGAWNNPGSPNTASEWNGPLGTGNSGLATNTSWGNSIGISSSGYIHHFSVVMDEEVDCNVGRSTNPDIAASWTNGFGTNADPNGNAGTSPPWTTVVIDKTMSNQCKVLAFAPLASDVMLAVYSNGQVAQPNLTNLRYQRSGTGATAGVWTNIPGNGGGGQGNVFSGGGVNINQNDWALVPVNPTTVYAFRRNAAGTLLEGRTYSVTGNSWSTLSPAPPAFGTGRTVKSGGGLFGATDGTSVWLFFINGHASDSSNSILYTKLSAGSWTPWAIVPGTNTGTHVRNFISGYQKPSGSGQIGLAWTEGTTTFDVFTTALNATGGGPTPSATITAPEAASTVSGTTVTVSATATPGIGTVAGVQFILDGVNLGDEDTSSPYEVSWDTTTEPNGTHFLSAVARDSNGGTGPGNTITVTVLNDGAPPTVAMTTPSSGATVSGTLLLEANAADDNGVAGVQFLLDGQPLGPEVTTPPYAVLWDSSAVAGGAHTLAARARDTAGNLTTSAVVDVIKLIVTPIITWPTPAPVFHLTVLGPQQLNATTTVPGTFTYLPAAGTVLPVGTSHSLTVTFTPADAINYTTAAAAVSITVIDKTAPSVTAPASISVPATEMGGARGNVAGSVGSQSLNAFLSAGSAADAGDAAPVRLPTEALISGTWTPVTSETLFPKGNTTVRFSFRDASGNTGNSTSVVTVTARIADEPTVFSTVAMGGGRLQTLQNPDGGWPFRVGGAGCAGTFGTCSNTFGVIGLGLLAADRHAGATLFRPAAILAGDALITRYQAAIAQTPQQLPFNQDIEFLVELSGLTGNPVYATTARAWFQVAIDRFPNAADRIDDFVARRNPGRLRSVAAWDAASFIRAAKAAGDLDYALAAAIRTRDLEPIWKDTDPAHKSGQCGISAGCGPADNPQSFKYTILGEGSLLWAIHDLPGFDAQVNEYRAFLLAQQDPAGSWDGGDSQVTSYVTIGLAAVGGTGTSAAMTAAANFFLAQQLLTGGWPFSASSPGEYGAVDGEVVRAISTLFSTRAGANVAVAPAQLSNVTFSTVTTSGVTTVVAIEPATAPNVIGGFEVVGGLTYQVNTTAAISGDIIVCFSVPWVTDAEVFAAIRILHGESGVMVDRTILAPDQPAPDFATRRVCARTTSLSPFAVALARPDTMPPALTMPADVTIEATGPLGAAHTFAAWAADDVDGTFAATCVPASGATFAFGSTTVTCGAADGAGNTAAPMTFTVSVIDTTPPVVTVPANVTIGRAPGNYSFTASATDAVDGALVPACTPPSGTRFPIGSTTVTCRATDARGNMGSATFTVTVKAGRRPDDSAPVADSASYSVKANTVLTGFLKARDADGDQLTFQLVTNESKGTVVVDPRTGAFSFTPNRRDEDDARFTFRVTDGKHWSNVARVRVDRP